MSLKCGIVGLPNVGKSTLFNALTKAGIAAENYPFCTIEPNVGVVEVPDTRLAQLSDIVTPERIVPAIVEFVDIAGLVAGASTGEGLEVGLHAFTHALFNVFTAHITLNEGGPMSCRQASLAQTGSARCPVSVSVAMPDQARPDHHCPTLRNTPRLQPTAPRNRLRH